MRAARWGHAWDSAARWFTCVQNQTTGGKNTICCGPAVCPPCTDGTIEHQVDLGCDACVCIPFPKCDKGGSCAANESCVTCSVGDNVFEEGKNVSECRPNVAEFGMCGTVSNCTGYACLAELNCVVNVTSGAGTICCDPGNCGTCSGYKNNTVIQGCPYVCVCVCVCVCARVCACFCACITCLFPLAIM